MMFRSPLVRFMALLLASLALLRGQGAAVEFRELAVANAAAPLRFAVAVPAGFVPERAYPTLLALPGGAQDEGAVTDGLNRRWGEVCRRGWIVVSPVSAGREADLPALLRHLRQTFRIEQGGMHLVGAEAVGVDAMWRIALAQPQEFQTVTAWPANVPQRDQALAHLRGRRVALFAATGGSTGESAGEPLGAEVAARNVARLQQSGIAARVVDCNGEPDGMRFAELLETLHGERVFPGAAGNVSAALDDFHDAAAKGDEDRYFALLPDDAVFLGTDGTERWTGKEFRAFALPYFQRGPAWTYVPISRHVTMASGDALAWFDERLDNEGYGECRGSGVLEKRGERWVVRQYNLSIPVPNDIARGVVELTRSFFEKRLPVCTTVVVVRHAEKGAGEDPDLDEVGKARSDRLQRMLASLPVSAVFASEFRRTQATVKALCDTRKLSIEVVPAAKTKELAARVRQDHLGETVVVAGHSNTVPALLKALGVTETVVMAEEDYDWLYVVTIGIGGARLLRLHY
jgi:phosphohistidine phosphatase SixA